MIQTARGLFSLAIKFPTDLAAIAPSEAIALTLSALKSQTTDSWPARIRRRTILAPIRPRPIIPSCILNSFYYALCLWVLVVDSSSPLRHEGHKELSESLVDRCCQLPQTFRNISTQMHAQRPASTFAQHFEITAGLRCFDNAESIFLAGHPQIVFIVARHLQKYSAVRAALVGLARRMQKTRSES